MIQRKTALQENEGHCPCCGSFIYEGDAYYREASEGIIGCSRSCVEHELKEYEQDDPDHLMANEMGWNQ